MEAYLHNKYGALSLEAPSTVVLNSSNLKISARTDSFDFSSSPYKSAGLGLDKTSSNSAASINGVNFSPLSVSILSSEAFLKIEQHLAWAYCT